MKQISRTKQLKNGVSVPNSLYYILLTVHIIPHTVEHDSNTTNTNIEEIGSSKLRENSKELAKCYDDCQVIESKIYFSTNHLLNPG